MKLPLWRLALGFLVLAAMAAILVMLAPVYVENYRLGQYVKQLVRSPDTSDQNLRSSVIARAHQLDLPVESEDIKITRGPGKIELQTKYAVQIDYPLYQVDLHLHAGASSK